MFDKTFLSPQVKQSVIISNKHCIYELPHELLNDLGFRILENWKKLEKSINFIEWLSSSQSFSYIQNFLNSSKNFWKIELTLFPECAISHEN